MFKEAVLNLDKENFISNIKIINDLWSKRLYKSYDYEFERNVLFYIITNFQKNKNKYKKYNDEQFKKIFINYYNSYIEELTEFDYILEKKIRNPIQRDYVIRSLRKRLKKLKINPAELYNTKRKILSDTVEGKVAKKLEELMKNEPATDKISTLLRGITVVVLSYIGLKGKEILLYLKPFFPNLTENLIRQDKNRILMKLDSYIKKLKKSEK